MSCLIVKPKDPPCSNIHDKRNQNTQMDLQFIWCAIIIYYVIFIPSAAITIAASCATESK